MINVVMVSKTPLACAPYENMKCINKYSSEVKVRWIALKTNYNDGRSFPSDIIYQKNSNLCYEILKQADIIHVQNDIFDFGSLLHGKRFLVQFHSVPVRANVEELKKLSKHQYTISQPLQQLHFKDLPSLPNMLDPEEYKVVNVNTKKLNVVFAPTNKYDSRIAGSKGYNDIMPILHNLRGKINIDVFNNLEYVDNLNHKRNADIIIDDVINNTWHRTSLEGCCFGKAVLTNCNLPGFVKTNIDNLDSNIRTLYLHRDLLEEYKIKSRKWITEYWHPKNLVQQYVDAYKKVLS